MSTRPTYDREFKIAAVKLVTEQQYSIADAARNLGVSNQTLRNWLNRYEPSDEHNGQLTDKDAEIRRLRAELQRVRMEREILKKATAFFAKEKP